jgi:calcium-translocating P-type ATPase
MANQPHLLTTAAVLAALEVNPSTGLSSAEAKRRLETYGPNALPEKPPTPWWKMLLEEFEDRMVQILLAAALVSFIMAVAAQDTHDLIEPFVILTILVLNAAVGIWQESSAESAINALKLLVPSRAAVLRDGMLLSLPTEELVPGDIVEVAVGSRVPADLRIINLLSTTVRVDQALLTGESLEIMKHTDVVTSGERFPRNLMFSGTNVTYGKARAVVVATGSKTEIGTIEQEVREAEEEKTPLQQKLDEFSELLAKVIGVICILVFVVNVFRFVVWTKDKSGGYLAAILHSIKMAISLAVAAIPEGLPAVVTTCLALGTRRMAQQNALVRNLPSVETLGCCTVICSDKTGTLTTNMMSVSTVISFNDNQTLREYSVADTQFNIADNSVSLNGSVVQNPVQSDVALSHFALVCSLCNDANLEYNEKTKSVQRVGEATEAALRVLSEKLGPMQGPSPSESLSPDQRIHFCADLWKKTFHKNATLEFTRERKSMSVHCTAGPVSFLLVKGAPEAILERSTTVLLAGGKEVPLSAELRGRILEALKRMSTGTTTLRCLAGAYRKIGPVESLDLSDPHKFVNVESQLTLCGIAGMLDPPRAEVPLALQECNTAGIRVIVITGDNKDTAESICRRIGLFDEHESLKGKSFTGAEFDALTPGQQVEAVQTARLFSRTDPSLKGKLVSLLQQQKFVCAMTGDGVNDAPALKKSDIGIAMGSGTEVAKAASKMVLADDNFRSIVLAIAEGRAIYNNTKQFIRYLISSNIGEVVCIFTTGLLGLPDALEPVQLLWVNLVTDGLPATALGFNPPDPDIMQQPPRKPNEPIVNGWLFTRYVIIGVYVGVATIGGFIWWFIAHGYSMSEIMDSSTCTGSADRCAVLADPREARAVALSVLVVVEMFNALNAISENESVLTFPPYKNPWLILAVISSLTLHYIVLYVPWMCYMFNVAPLGVPGVDPRHIENEKSWFLVPTEFSEWKGIFVFSFPVMLVDEVLKAVTRYLQAHKKQE